MSFGDAATPTRLLTVGDGLVSQIPALIVSTAAGLMVSKAGIEGDGHRQGADRPAHQAIPKALGMTASLCWVGMARCCPACRAAVPA
jgi:flagellar biosynthesis protein FlhA